MRHYALALAIAALPFCIVPCNAQIKLPVFDPQAESETVRGVVYEPATVRQDFRHGSLLRITLNDNAATKIQGTLVRVDHKNNQLWVRTAPNNPPRAVAQKDIKSVDKAIRKASSPIKPAVVQETAVVQPEIHQMVVFNGGVRSVHYFGATLSPAEQARLQELEDAENDFVQLERLQGQRTAFVETELAIQAERQRSHALINLLLTEQANAGYYMLPASSSFHVLFLKHDQIDIGRYLTPPSAEAVAKARANVRAYQYRAVYENGRLVAVLTDDQAPAPK